MMGVRAPETCWAVHKRQVINLRNCYIWLVDLFEIWKEILDHILCRTRFGTRDGIVVTQTAE